MPHSSGGGKSSGGSNSSTTTTAKPKTVTYSNSSTTTKKPNYGTTTVTTKHVTKVPQYTTQSYSVTDYTNYTITKTTYFNSCNLDDLLSAINKIITDLRTINYSYAISGIWEATSGSKLSHELSKMPTYANILLACLIGYVEVINKARSITSLQKQVDQVDSSSHDYYTVKALQDQINSQITWFDAGVAAIKNQSALPGSISEKYTGNINSTYRFDYGSVNSVANQAKSESDKLVSIYKQYCELESKVKKDSYLYYGWNAIVLDFDKMIGKRDSIENWWTNYMKNIKGLENALPDNEYTITETETKKEAMSHDAVATPNLDSYKNSHKGSTSTFRVATGSHTETKTVKTGDKDVVSYTYSNVPRTTPSNGYIKNLTQNNTTNPYQQYLDELDAEIAKEKALLQQYRDKLIELGNYENYCAEMLSVQADIGLESLRSIPGFGLLVSSGGVAVGAASDAAAYAAISSGAQGSVAASAALPATTSTALSTEVVPVISGVSASGGIVIGGVAVAGAAVDSMVYSTVIYSNVRGYEKDFQAAYQAVDDFLPVVYDQIDKVDQLQAERDAYASAHNL